MNDRAWKLCIRAFFLFLLLDLAVACSETEPTIAPEPTPSIVPELESTSKPASAPSETPELTSIPTIIPTTKPGSTTTDQEAEFQFVLLATLQDEQADDPFGNWITRLVFAPGGQTLASGHANGTVRLWDIPSGTMLRSFEAGEEDVRAIEFTPDGSTLLTVGVFGWGYSGMSTIHLWDVASGQQLEGIETRLAVENIAVSPDGSTVAAATWNTGQPGSMGRVSLYDLASGEHVRDLGPLSDPAYALAYSPDGNSIAAGEWIYAQEGSDRQIFVWDPATGETRAVVEGHTDWIGDLAYAGDGQTLVSISYDDSLRLWDAESGEQAYVLTPPRGEHWAGLANAADNQLIAALTDEATVLIWDVKTGQEVFTFQESSEPGFAEGFPALTNSLRKLAFTPDGTLLATGTDEGAIHLWGSPGALAALGSAANQIEAGPGDSSGQSGGAVLTPATTLVHDSAPISDLAISADGQLLACNCDDFVRLWDTSSGQELATLEADPGRSSGNLAISPDNLRLASAQYSGDVILWNLAIQDTEARSTSESRLEAEEHFPDGLIAFDPEGRLLVYNRAGGLLEWDPATGEQKPVMDNAWSLQAIEYLRDGRGVAVTSGLDDLLVLDAGSPTLASLSRDIDSGETALIDLRTGEEPTELSYPYSFSPGTSQIAVWDLETGEEVARIDLGSRLNTLAISPDGTRIALATAGGMIQLWDQETQLKVATLPAGVQAIDSVAFSPDGRLLASGSIVGDIRLWDLASGTELARVQAPADEEEGEGWVRSLLFTPDGEMLISGSGGTIQFWSVKSLSDD